MILSNILSNPSPCPGHSPFFRTHEVFIVDFSRSRHILNIKPSSVFRKMADVRFSVAAEIWTQDQIEHEVLLFTL